MAEELMSTEEEVVEGGRDPGDCIESASGRESTAGMSQDG